VGDAAAIAIGAMVCLDAMSGGSITGASMNPARSLFGWVQVPSSLDPAAVVAFEFDDAP
jgi:glycerol uptake facilitator-like aquaporin